MELKDILKKDECNNWVYDINILKPYVEDISSNYSNIGELTKALGVYREFLSSVEKKYDFKFNYHFQHNKYSMNFKAIYQDYDWCYQKYVIERKTYQEMADELGCSKRVIEKWCSERHKLNQHTIRHHLKLTDMQKRLILASLLGDGHIDKRENNPIFIVSHAENQKDYLYWKHNILKNLCNKKPSIIQGKAKDYNGKIYECQKQYRMCTKVVDELAEYRKLSKIDIIKQLDEFQLSVYFLDDGCRDDSNWTLCVASFTQEEKEFFINYIKEKFNLIGYVTTFDNRYIKLTSDSSRDLDNIILKNIPNELDIVKYKIINKVITKPANYVYIIDKDNKKVGISAYFKNNPQRCQYQDLREYLLSKNIKEINYNRIDEYIDLMEGNKNVL